MLTAAGNTKGSDWIETASPLCALVPVLGNVGLNLRSACQPFPLLIWTWCQWILCWLLSKLGSCNTFPLFLDLFFSGFWKTISREISEIIHYVETVFWFHSKWASQLWLCLYSHEVSLFILLMTLPWLPVLQPPRLLGYPETLQAGALVGTCVLFAWCTHPLPYLSSPFLQDSLTCILWNETFADCSR